MVDNIQEREAAKALVELSLNWKMKISNLLCPRPETLIHEPQQNSIVVKVENITCGSKGQGEGAQMSVQNLTADLVKEVEQDQAAITTELPTPRATPKSPNSTAPFKFKPYSTKFVFEANEYQSLPKCNNIPFKPLVVSRQPKKYEVTKKKVRENNKSNSKERNALQYIEFPSPGVIPLSLGPKKSTSGKNTNSMGFCTRCGVLSTPEWRRGPEQKTTLCSACGLFYTKLVDKFGKFWALKLYEARLDNPRNRKLPTSFELVKNEIDEKDNENG